MTRGFEVSVWGSFTRNGFVFGCSIFRIVVESATRVEEKDEQPLKTPRARASLKGAVKQSELVYC